MNRYRLLSLFGALGLALAPAIPALARQHPAPPCAVAEKRAPVTILVSIDGFRADYLARGVTPNLAELVAGGVRAEMRPSFPSVTFPNHWTLVTGLRPDRHGIVNGTIHDPSRPGIISVKTEEDPFWWSAADPIWVSAEKAGIRSATMFWPGSSVAIGGVRPSVWAQFAKAITSAQRADTVLDWLRRPAAKRPRLVTLYFDAVDIAGHHFGPDSAEVRQAMAEVDTAIGGLRAGLKELGQPANLVVVSDHGMAAIDPARVLQLGDYVDRADYVPLSGGPVLFVDPVPGHEAALAAGLARLPGYVHCWPKGHLPERFHFGTNPRAAGWTCLSDIGAAVLVTPVKSPADRGDHGYDNDAIEMRALFIGNGPAFARGKVLPEFDNVDIEPLLRDLIGLPQATGRDGDDAPFLPVISRRR